MEFRTEYKDWTLIIEQIKPEESKVFSFARDRPEIKKKFLDVMKYGGKNKVNFEKREIRIIVGFDSFLLYFYMVCCHEIGHVADKLSNHRLQLQGIYGEMLLPCLRGEYVAAEFGRRLFSQLLPAYLGVYDHFSKNDFGFKFRMALGPLDRAKFDELLEYSAKSFAQLEKDFAEHTKIRLDGLKPAEYERVIDVVFGFLRQTIDQF
ncbi:hypothetical protein HQ571_02020 [Candidatus Kuenenbacteria bacterium]|nr:hypothetical protein [Candidatus Kuenenbacteria bacterium]